MASPSKKQKTPQKNSVVLNTGAHMPLVGLGTYLSKPGEVARSVKAALAAGYRHIDCAMIYKNEKEIGEALKEVFSDPKSGVKREDVFITSKLWSTDHHPDSVKKACESTLNDLQLEYLNLYLIHIPINVEGSKYRKRAGYGLQDTWRAMEALVDAKLVRAIGVSNFGSALLTDMQNYARIMPAVNQIELNPYLVQAEHRAYCKELGIAITAYGSLGAAESAQDKLNVPLLSNPVIGKLADKYKKSAGQILLRWAVQQDVIVIPKSINPERIAENFDVFDFNLADEDLAAVSALDQKLRVFKQSWPGVPLFEEL